jgi:hypothetical protein
VANEKRVEVPTPTAISDRRLFSRQDAPPGAYPPWTVRESNPPLAPGSSLVTALAKKPDACPVHPPRRKADDSNATVSPAHSLAARPGPWPVHPP